MVFIYGEIGKAGSRLLIASGRAAVRFRNIQIALSKYASDVSGRPRRLREARWTKEHHLRNLLAISRDATIVTDDHRRLIAANQQALDLFGISESNAKSFSMDVFLVHGQIVKPGANNSTGEPQERHGECRIRRLDGSLRLAEYVFVPNVLSRRNLYKFMNAVPYRLAPPGYTAREARERFMPDASGLPATMPRSEHKVVKQVTMKV